jgi:hypothetical protein
MYFLLFFSVLSSYEAGQARLKNAWGILGTLWARTLKMYLLAMNNKILSSRLTGRKDTSTLGRDYGTGTILTSLRPASRNPAG